MRNYQIMRYLLIVCWIIGNMPSGWAAEGGSTYTPVSYTHLTLPTIRLV